MQLINRWPKATDFQLPPQTVEEIMRLLIEPFEDEQEACASWNVLGVKLLVLEAQDTPALLADLNPNFLEHIRFTLKNPDTKDFLAHGYQLLLGITSSEGSGFYLVIHQDSPLVKEL